MDLINFVQVFLTCLGHPRPLSTRRTCATTIWSVIIDYPFPVCLHRISFLPCSLVCLAQLSLFQLLAQNLPCRSSHFGHRNDMVHQSSTSPFNQSSNLLSTNCWYALRIYNIWSGSFRQLCSERTPVRFRTTPLVHPLTFTCSDNRDKVETYLAFGASRFEACRPIAKEALRLALTPIVNQMRSVRLRRGSRLRLTAAATVFLGLYPSRA